MTAVSRHESSLPCHTHRHKLPSSLRLQQSSALRASAVASRSPPSLLSQPAAPCHHYSHCGRSGPPSAVAQIQRPTFQLWAFLFVLAVQPRCLKGRNTLVMGLCKKFFISPVLSFSYCGLSGYAPTNDKHGMLVFQLVLVATRLDLIYGCTRLNYLQLATLIIPQSR